MPPLIPTYTGVALLLTVHVQRYVVTALFTKEKKTSKEGPRTKQIYPFMDH